MRSLVASERRPDRILVVHNDTPERSPGALARALPAGVEVIDAGCNLGFSGGCNLGLRAALDGGADLLLLANSDVIAPPAALGTLESALLAHPTAGIAGPALITTGQPARIESLGIVFSARTGRMRLRRAGASPDAAPPVRETVDAVAGAFMLLRRAVLERIGLFDEDYFYGFEDLDLCLRARRAGFTVLCAGDARVEHVGAASIGVRSPRRVYYATRNHLLVAQRAAPLPAALGALRAGCILGYNLAHSLTRSPAPLGGALRAFLRGGWDHLHGRYGEGG